MTSPVRHTASQGTAGRLTLVYVGADAELVPAASVRELAGAGPVFVPRGLPQALRDLLTAAVAAPLASTATLSAAPPEAQVAGGSRSVPPAPEAAASGAVQAACGQAHAAGSRAQDATGPVGLLVEIDPADPADAIAAARAQGAVVAVAGAHGPALARALLTAVHVGHEVTTVPSRPLFEDCLTGQELVSLARVTRTLRELCPWDRVQTAQDIVSYSLEEVYELADAIARGDTEEEHGELGDVLFQVYFLSLLLAEQDVGDLGSVAAAIERKLVRRHAHIFAGAVAETPAEVRGQWERIKREQEGREGIFHDVPAALPALLYARKLQRRAAEVGFDWQSAHEAFPKIAEEHGELAAALATHEAVGELHDTGGEGEAPSPPRPEMRHDPRLRHELGDLLFAVTNVARKAGVDPELALREAAQRFERRVAGAAELAAAEGLDWAALGLPEQETYYQRVKAQVG